MDPRERLKGLLTKEVVDCLADLFPDRCPNANDSDRQVWISAGSAYVVRTLRTILEEVAEDNAEALKSHGL